MNLCGCVKEQLQTLKYGNEKDAGNSESAGFPHLFLHFGEDIGIKHLHAVTVYGDFLTMNGSRGEPTADHMEKLRNGCFGYERPWESGLQISAEK